MGKKEILNQLEEVEELRNAYELACKNNFENSDYAISAFHEWHMAAVELFVELFGEEDKQLQKFRPNGVGGNGYVLRDAYRSILGTYTMLKVRVKKYGDRIEETPIVGKEKMEILKDKIKPKKIFISHAKTDKAFAEALVQLLRIIGFAEDEIFCSSIPGYWIGNNKSFLTEIKTHFINYDLFVIFIHSPQFYKSHIALNEMGAAWVLQSAYCSFLTKDMDLGMMDAVVTNQEIVVKVDNDEAEPRMTDWKDRIIEWFGKPNVNSNIWEQARTAFLKSVNMLTSESQLEKKEVTGLSKEDEEILKKWVDSEDDTMYYGEFLGGDAFLVLGNTQYSIHSAREKSEWLAFFQRMSSMNLVEQVGTEGLNPIYRLTVSAYTYFE